MLIKISDKGKKDLFLSIFHILKGCSSSVTLYLKSDHLYIQGMDKAHVCLFEIKLDANWFDSYSDVVSCTDICVSTVFFYNILSTCEDKHTIELCYNSDEDNDSDDFEEESDDEIIYSNSNPSNEYKKNFHKNLAYYPLNSGSRYSYKVFVIDSNMILDDESPKWIIDKPLLFDNVPIINAQLTLIISK